MTEIREAFPEIDSLEPFELENLRTEILSTANGDWRSLNDETLTKLWKVTRALRKKAAHAGSRGRTNGTKKPKVPVSVDDLL